MNRQEVFEAWKKRKGQIEVRPDFSAQVMNRIRTSRPSKGTPAWTFLVLNQIAARPWAKAALIAVGVSLGLARILLTLQLILLA
jgi:hypothetical protein